MRRVTPLPRGMGRARAIVVFGGSFDPVHKWHTAVASAARRRAGKGSWIVFAPAARSPHKRPEDGPRASDRDRVEMLRRATCRMARTAVWTDELDRGGASYTVQSLRRLRGLVGAEVRVVLVIGADQAVNFHAWRAYREVMRLAEVMVALRPPRRSAGSLARALRATGAWSEPEVEAWMGRVVKCGVRAVSSTEVRAAAARGDRAGLRRLVSAPVARWIEARGLYRA